MLAEQNYERFKEQLVTPYGSPVSCMNITQEKNSSFQLQAGCTPAFVEQAFPALLNATYVKFR